MSERRAYSRRQKAAAVGLSVVAGASEASRQTGIPESSIRYWREQPAFAELREQKKEDVALDVFAAFQEGVHRIRELIPQTDDLQKVATATGIIYDKFALMAGQATSRSERRDLTDNLADGEKEALADAIDEWLQKAKA